MSNQLQDGEMMKKYHQMKIAGVQNKYFDITIKDGKFDLVKEVKQSGLSEKQEEKEQDNLWMAPGIIDLHTHLAWTDFDSEDQQKREKSEIFRMQEQAFQATLRTGVTTVRDAGGLLPDEAEAIKKYRGCPLRVLPCGGMFSGSDAKGIAFLENQTDKMQKTGAKWIKIFATGGLGAPPDKVLEPMFGRDEFFAIVQKAHACGMKTMIHTWGGITIDWAIEAGADTLEHGVYLTKEQAEGLEKSKMPYIPTTAIYRIAADKNGVLGLNRELRDRAAKAAENHPRAVAYAKEAGVKIGFGTDFATPALHGNNLQEIYTMQDCGLTVNEVWQSATTAAAEILGYQNSLGKIEEGFISDAVIYNRDPLQAVSAEELQNSIVSVITGQGHLFS